MILDKLYSFDTRVIHNYYDPVKNLGSLTAPIYQTSTYVFDSVEEGAACFSGESNGYIYTRINNPTLSLLEKRIADLSWNCIFFWHGSDNINTVDVIEPRR